MNWDAVGAIGEIIGATAVLITLIYVSIQLKKTNDISRFNASKEIADSFDNMNQMIVTDPSLRQAIHKTTELSSDEKEQVYAFVNMFCNTWLMIQTAYDNGLLDEEFFKAAKRDVPFELDRWPNVRPFVLIWLDRFPEIKEFEMFSPLKENG